MACGACRAACPEGIDLADADARAACTRCGACVDACPTEARRWIGGTRTVDDVMTEVAKDVLFYDESGGGATFSGGEPLAQPEFLAGLLQACRNRGIHTAVDTCGFASQEPLLALAPLVDLFLYDVKVLDDARHRAATGASNRPILENLRALAQVHRNIWLRTPLVPGVNDNEEALAAIARLAAALPAVRQVNLLPFHRTGLHKWETLGLPSPACWRGSESEVNPDGDRPEWAADVFRSHGVKVQIGG